MTIDATTAIKHATNQGRRGQKLSEAYRSIEAAREAHSKGMQLFLRRQKQKPRSS